MLILLAIDRFPATSARAFTDKAMEELRDNPYPEFTKRNYYFKLAEGGIVMYIIYEIDPGDEDAALKDINARGLKFAQEVEGFEMLSMEPLMSIQETLTLMQEEALPS
jgi:hypothetical protein